MSPAIHRETVAQCARRIANLTAAANLLSVGSKSCAPTAPHSSNKQTTPRLMGRVQRELPRAAARPPTALKRRVGPREPRVATGPLPSGQPFCLRSCSLVAYDFNGALKLPPTARWVGRAALFQNAMVPALDLHRENALSGEWFARPNQAEGSPTIARSMAGYRLNGCGGG